MKAMIHKLSKAQKSVIASVLALVMVFGVFAFIAPIEAQAISVDATDPGFYNIAYGESGKTTFGRGTQIRVINYTRQGKSKNDAVYQFDGVLSWEPVGDKYIVWEGTVNNTFYGVYPYNAEYESFKIPTDQAGGVQDADWMTDDFIANKSAGKVDFTFQHRLAKVTVNITNWNSEFVGAAKVIDDQMIYTKGIEVTANYENGVTITATGEDTGIDPYVDSTSYTAIVAPAAYDASDKFMTFTVDGQEMTVLATASQLTEGLKPGNHYTFDLTVGKDVVEITEVKVNGWADGGTINGGVAEAVEVTTVINGTTATLIIPKVATDAMVKDAMTEALDAGMTTLMIEGSPTDTQQEAIAEALADKTDVDLIMSEVVNPVSAITALTDIDLAYKNGTGDNGYAVVDNTYIITSKDGLNAWKTAAESNAGTNLTLACDIEYNANWSWLYNVYSGIIDGNGYAIVGLNSSGWGSAFIRILGNGGVIKHLGIVGGRFHNDSTDMSAGSAAFVYENRGVIMGCYNTSSCTSTGSWDTYGAATGIAYKSRGKIVACYNAGTISAGGGYGSGICAQNDGLYNSSEILSCYNTGAVSGEGHTVSAISSCNEKIIHDCYYTQPSLGYKNSWSSATATNITRVYGNDWTAAMNAMNAAIEEYNETATVKCNYRYVLNTDAATKNAQPLIIVEVES